MGRAHSTAATIGFDAVFGRGRGLSTTERIEVSRLASTAAERIPQITKHLPEAERERVSAALIGVLADVVERDRDHRTSEDTITLSIFTSPGTRKYSKYSVRTLLMIGESEAIIDALRLCVNTNTSAQEEDGSTRSLTTTDCSAVAKQLAWLLIYDRQLLRDHNIDVD